MPEITDTIPETVTIDGLIFSRPFKRDATFTASIGAPLGSWLVEVCKPGHTGCSLTIADARVLAAFGITET